ncbi:Ger(x)C family spore germination protein [Paenibacillus sp. GSMTC-2017]|uniref:Ger(x)C family spore germination protein n=1 Tax=Paenibacillus sp. GSMTC-2017 TaxID=2794350 RepID=UPI0018D869E4|nr:Ger(x)C family spore germination protein [Paenibacillus sp. GSMTC-2017]MBH5318415.1 Ger(x)C family spore germination protein [Paenibacillus sp. GSMTC-2017]
MKWYTLLLIVCLLTGCTIKKEIVEDIYIALGTAVDLAEKTTLEGGNEESGDELYKITISVPTFHSNQKIESQFYEGKGDNLKSVMMKMNHTSDQYISNSKINVLLFSKPILQLGIQDFTEILSQDPLLSGRMLLAMTTGNADHLFQKKYPHTNQPLGRYLCQVIHNNIKTFGLPLMNLHQFIYELKGEGMDPVMPIIDAIDDRVSLTGIALLKDAAYVGKMSLDEIYPYSWMKQKHTQTSFFKVKLKDRKELSIRNLKTKMRYHYSNTNKEMSLYIRLTGKLMESNEAKPVEINTKELNIMINNQIKIECESLVKKFQKLNVDPLGFGNDVRAHSKTWNEKVWKQQYPHVKIKVVVDSRIVK